MRSILPLLLLGALAAPVWADGDAAADQAAPAVDAAERPPVVGDSPPEEVKADVGIEPRPDAQLPLDAVFMSDAGEQVTLGDYFGGERPVLLNFVYFRCPSLCNVALNELLETLRGMAWTPGQEFDIVTVSINPMESANLARGKKRSYLSEYGRPEAAAGWHWLTGNDKAIRQLTDTVGFNYRFDTVSEEYAHSAGLFICTPDGRLSRTLYGVMQPSETVRLSLVEAGDGKVGSTLDQLILYCYHYDPDTGQYTAAIMNMVRLFSLLTVFLVGGTVATFLHRERRQRALAVEEGAETDSPTHPPSPAATGGSVA